MFDLCLRNMSIFDCKVGFFLALIVFSSYWSFLFYITPLKKYVFIKNSAHNENACIQFEYAVCEDCIIFNQIFNQFSTAKMKRLVLRTQINIYSKDKILGKGMKIWCGPNRGGLEVGLCNDSFSFIFLRKDHKDHKAHGWKGQEVSIYSNSG